jgi:membrane protein DedA with SNARE-associated domain
MGERLFEVLRGYFAVHGYWTVALALLLENAGVPVPGETILLFASFLAKSERSLHLPLIIVVGTIAATIGDNTGYWIGRRGGRPLLQRYQHIFRIREHHIRHGEKLFEKHGATTVFFARFIFGMRIIAGPLAGVLCMEWKRFALYNFLGAVTWVTTISVVGFIFGHAWEHLLHIVKNANVAVAIVSVLVVIYVVWRRRREASETDD